MGVEPPVPVAKRPRTLPPEKDGDQIRVRHILVKHRDLKNVRDKVRNTRVLRTQQEAEEMLRAALVQLVSVERDPRRSADLFTQKCRELSECTTALKGGDLAGDLGWL